LVENKTDRKKEFKRRVYNFTLKLIGFIDTLLKDNISKRLGDQLLRSGTSVIANYIEGQAANSKKDFTNFLNISLKSSNESKLWLSLLKDCGKASEKDTKWLLQELIEISNILAASIITLRSKR
jgi:four helix bundle protein